MKRESIIQKFLIYAALIFVILASGCVSIGPTTRTYTGDKLQKSEVAVIKGWWYPSPFGYAGMDIYEINGSPVKATKVEVLPGWYELVIRDYMVSFFPLYGVPPTWFTRGAFDFEPGHEYKIKCPLFTPGCKIVDVTTGAVILNLPKFKNWEEFFKRQ